MNFSRIFIPGKIAYNSFLCRQKHDFIITTPIFYCNSSPHIGHLYSVVIADAANRFQQLLHGQSTCFVTGTDEHGSKIQEAAARSNLPVPKFCDKVSYEYKKLFSEYDIAYSHFIRTTDADHKKAVSHFWDELHKREHIYKGEYSGWYCVADEAFLSESDVKDSPKIIPGQPPAKVSAESGQPVFWTTEENFMFKLSSFRGDLLHWLKNENVVQPLNFYKTLKDWLSKSEDLGDLSISRPSARVPWGIPVPNHPNQTIYVWLDALINYLTAVGYPNKNFTDNWPPNIQVLGKDILKFHGIYWPAFLISVGLEPPPRLHVHSHWTVNGEKMSKSRGNVFAPPSLSGGSRAEELIAMRYFLLRTGTPQSDNNFSVASMEQDANEDLASALGNLLNRCTSLVLNPKQEYPPFTSVPDTEISRKLMESIQNLADEVEQHFKKCNFYMGINSIGKTVNVTNAFLSISEPWKFSKAELLQGKQTPIIHLAMEGLRVCGIALQPIVPSLASKLLTKLGIPEQQRSWEDMKSLSWKNGHSSSGYKLEPQHVVLFERIKSSTKDAAKRDRKNARS